MFHFGIRNHIMYLNVCVCGFLFIIFYLISFVNIYNLCNGVLKSVFEIFKCFLNVLRNYRAGGENRCLF